MNSPPISLIMKKSSVETSDSGGHQDVHHEQLAAENHEQASHTKQQGEDE